ncbi:MAG: TIM barrel protein [Mariniblastus sp.]|nr:TIM barrel protein [Mariniblastus sp.]
MSPTNTVTSQSNRRHWLKNTLAGSAGLLASWGLAKKSAAQEVESPQIKAPGEDYKIVHGRAKQSVMAWCFNPMPMEKLIPACAKMGLSAMEGIDKKYYPLMKQHGLGVSITGSHGFKKGPINRANHQFCTDKLRAGIDLAVQWNCPGVITFTGMREDQISDKQAFANCIECWKGVCEYAEEKEVNVVLEMLNTRDDSHPMKGHPGYFGDDIDLCVDLIKAVGSPRMKLLFDVYHVQIMNGDPIRHFQQNQEYVSHVHTAGNPGRCELDENQELNYPPIIKAILETGYDGFIAQEFIPTWNDKLAALRHGVKTCDV